MTATAGRPALPLSPVQVAYRRGILAKLEEGQYSLEEVPACLCGSSEAVGIAQRDRYGIPVGVVLCRACGLARTSPRLAAKHLPAFYEHDYHGLHQSIRVPDPDAALFRVGQGTAIANFLAQLLPTGTLRVAEVGCGTGQVLREFAAAVGDRVIIAAGCEYASAFVNAGRRRGTDVRQGGPESLAGFELFDVVILSHVVEHFANPVLDLAAVRNLGHRATLFYVEVPGLLAIDRKAEYAYELAQYLTVAHTFHFTLATLTATMARAGFTIIHGDEDVHSVYRHGTAASPATNRTLAVSILASLEHLDEWRMRVRRLRPRVRQLAAATARRLPEEVYRHARRVVTRRDR